MRHPGNAPGSPAWHAGILLLNQCRMDWYGLMVMLHRLLFVRQARYYYAKPAESGASDRVGCLHHPLYKSGAIVRHAGMLVKLDTPPGIAPGAFALQATRFTSSVRGSWACHS